MFGSWYGEKYVIMFEFLRKVYYNYLIDFNFVFNYLKFYEIKI